MSSVLVLPDLHLPCMHDNLIRFAKKIERKYKCDTVLCIGDFFHINAITYYEKHPDEPTAIEEYQMVQAQVKQITKAFPKMLICYGNHDRRIQRKAASAGIPDMYLKNFNDVYGLPDTYEWDLTFEIDDVFYCHGDRLGGGLNPAFNQAKRMGKSVVAGHYHTLMGLEYTKVAGRRVFGMQVGCGIDAEHDLHQYNPKYMHLEMNGVGVVIDGVPHIEPL